MYSVHTTPGFIIDSRPYGEAGKILSIFTRDLGLIQATAQGIRFERSKLRYFAQEYSMGLFSVVRGKEYWKLTGAQESASRPEMKELAARIALLLRRLLHGEEPNPELFECIWDFVRFDLDISRSDLALALESLIVLRILHFLGYIGDDPALNIYLKSKDITTQTLMDIAAKRIIVNQHINKALRESHL